jgi:hypothetical protein
MITAYDGAGFSNCQTHDFLRLSFHTAENRKRIAAEYSEFTYELFRSHAGSGKRFIISNWESDNSVYCGAAYLYTHDANARASCDAVYQQAYGNASPEETMQALRLWFTARWEGIQEGRRRAAADGFAGITVHSAPEINSVRTLAEHGLPSVLENVVPFIPFDYVSYSSWESINRADTGAELKKDLDRIRQVAGAATVIVGEFGFARSTADAMAKIAEAISAAEQWGTPYIFHWVMYDDASGVGFGLFDQQGTLTELGRYYGETLSRR